ncbi:unnamed protein product [Boreogadus saida]
MVELAFYPAVALMYFFAVMRASKENLVELDDRASLNVFCLFVLCQPLCLVVGSYTGMLMYLVTALVSYHFLPWSATTAAAAADKDNAKDGKPSKKKKRCTPQAVPPQAVPLRLYPSGCTPQAVPPQAVPHQAVPLRLYPIRLYPSGCIISGCTGCFKQAVSIRLYPIRLYPIRLYPSGCITLYPSGFPAEVSSADINTRHGEALVDRRCARSIRSTVGPPQPAWRMDATYWKASCHPVWSRTHDLEEKDQQLNIQSLAGMGGQGWRRLQVRGQSYSQSVPQRDPLILQLFFVAFDCQIFTLMSLQRPAAQSWLITI